MDIDKAFGKLYEEVEKEARTYKDRTDDDEKKKKKHFAFGGKKKSRHGESGYGKGEEVDRKFVEAFGLDERKMTDAEMAEREEIVKKMKPKLQSFKDRYGDDAKSVMYATATKQAMEEVKIEEKKSATGYELYHKTFSDAMQHAYAHAKSKGFVVDPKEIDDKVATGPKKPSSGKTNRYSLKAGRKKVEIQVANLDNKRYELNMYIEAVELEEAFSMGKGDKRVVDAFYDQKEIKAHGASMLTTDGKTLTKRGMGGQDIAKYVNGKIKIVAVSDVKSTEEILRYMKKSIPSGVFEEVEIKEEFWAVIDKAKGGEVMAVSSDEKGAKSSVKMSNFSKHDYHFGKDPRTLKIVKVMGSYKKGEKMIGTKLSFKEEVQIDEKGTAYPATIDTLKMIVKDKQHQTVMFKSGQAIVDTFTASAMVAVYDAMKPATKKKFEAMIKDKGGFMKTQAFAMKMTEDAKWIDQIKEDPSMLELHYSLVQIDEAVHDKKSTFTMAPFEDLRGVADVALKIMQRQPLEVKEEEQEVTSEETPQKLTE